MGIAQNPLPVKILFNMPLLIKSIDFFFSLFKKKTKQNKKQHVHILHVWGFFVCFFKESKLLISEGTLN